MIFLSTPSSASGGGSDPIDTPNIFYVTTTGNDTTGDGTMAKPFASLGRAVTASNGDPCLFQLGTGTFGVTREGWPSNQHIHGAGYILTTINITHINEGGGVYPMSIYAHFCSIHPVNRGSDNFAPEGPGYAGGDIAVYGDCYVYNPNCSGGRGGSGTSGSPGTNGGVGGNGGSLMLEGVRKVIGVINTSGGIGGAGGVGNDGASDGVNGGDGNPGTSLFEGCNLLGVTEAPQTSVGISRCAYSSAIFSAITSNYGGNAAW